MSWDIPNYIALPAGILGSLVGSALLIVYQNKILDLWRSLSDKRSKITLFNDKKKYEHIKRLKNNPAKMSEVVARYTATAVCIDLYAFIIVFLSYYLFTKIDLSINDDKFLILLLLVTLIIFFGNMIIHFKCKIEVILVGSFEEFESQLRERWGKEFE
jgi:ABC-type multidrug transport system fused ATPase/permease subunit